MSNQKQDISIDSEVFSQMRESFDRILEHLLVKMEERQEEQGEITLKLKVELRHTEVDNFNPAIATETREATVPYFSHIIQSVVQEKHQIKGCCENNCEVVWDPVAGSYALVPLEEAQVSMYDE